MPFVDSLLRLYGSSPRLWGIHAARYSSLEPQSVHPHACGAYFAHSEYTWFVSGSSPRLWGILVENADHRCRGRFIPTPVGHTLSTTFLAVSAAVHPHACGAYKWRLKGHATDIGSSPRLWGIRTATWLHIDSIRFIPTPVGHTNRIAS